MFVQCVAKILTTIPRFQVLVGECARGTSNMVRPPPKDPSKPNGELYDSCVNNTSNPTIFVTFQISHAYPLYLLEYKPEDEGEDEYNENEEEDEEGRDEDCDWGSEREHRRRKRCSISWQAYSTDI